MKDVLTYQPPGNPGSAMEAISDSSMTFEELRIAKADDFPELAKGKKVWNR